MVTDALEVGVFIENSVVCVQEKVKGVLVEKVHLKENNAVCLCASYSKSQMLLLQVYFVDPKKSFGVRGAIMSRPD